jgi:undecaprenyl-diphosphatase
MTYLQAVVLALVQGVTELLPISSSGHLVLVPFLFGWKQSPLVFDTTLHLGTALALVVYFWKDLGRILKEKLTKNSLLVKIIAGSVPAGIIGFLIGDYLETSLKGVASVCVFLLLGSVLMFCAEKFGKAKVGDLGEVTPKKSFLIGLFQTLALLSGISRSGSTISGGLLLGLKREDAARFSFLLSIPVVLAAGVFELLKNYRELVAVSLPISITGFLVSFLAGLFAVWLLLKFVKNNKLYVFVVYRVVLVGMILLAFFN